MFLLIPVNTVHGFYWVNWFPEQEKSLQYDLMSGMSPSLLVTRHRKVLTNLIALSEIKQYTLMLRKAGIEPFVKMAEDRITAKDSTPGVTFTQPQPHPQVLASVGSIPFITQEIRYDMPEADAVYLIWGLNGGPVVPVELDSSSTERKNNVLRTPMNRKGNSFFAKVLVPAGSTLDYCFLISKKRAAFDITWLSVTATIKSSH